MKSIPGQKRSRRSIVAAVALATVALAGAACGDDQEPGGTEASMAPQGDAAAFAKCMRENGVPSFPAPGTDGGFVKNDKSNTPEFKKAEEACEEYQPQSIPNMTPSKTGGS
ncbi:hypothetical protein ACQEVF_47590 [Nonomuraea polychroma]|uniref:hypothetical protein n=1 Tax=Nonomuraea polychroma TaxID=46176 RepID=UPI003D93C865